MVKSRLIFFMLVSLCFYMKAQVGINTTNPNATLDIRSSNQATPTNNDGILIPKIDDFPSINPTVNQDGMLIYATGIGIPTKGFYYWDNTLTNWMLITGSGGGGGGNTLDQAYDQGGIGLGRTIDASDGAVRINGEDGFLITGSFGAGNTIDSEITGAGTRMFFNPNKAAFRAGIIYDFPPLVGDEWDDVNIGFNSTAFGINTLASGGTSTAFGSITTASGNNSTAFGSGTTASGDLATAFGSGTLASGAHSISFGYNTTSSATGSTAFGSFTIASGTYSTAFGHQSSASGLHSIAFGASSLASEEYAIAFGRLTEASGVNATAFGNQTTASGNYATSFGYFNTAAGLYSTSFGIATTALEDRSTAFGVSNLASGDASTVFGSTNTASGDISTAFGHRTNATGNISTAFGHQNTSSGAYSTAFGRISNASGNISTTFGMATDAPSYGEIAIGIYNTTYTPNSINTFNASDRLFSIGNGSSSFRSNALTIYKNGLMNINDAYDLPLTDGTINQVMTTNGAGVVSFQDVSNLINVNTLDQAYEQVRVRVGRIINTIKEQQEEIEAQNNKIEYLENQLKQQQKEIEDIKRQIKNRSN